MHLLDLFPRCLPVILLLVGLGLPAAGLAAEPAVGGLDEAQRQWLAAHRQLQVGVVLQAPYAQFERRRREQQLSGAHI